MAHQIKSRRHFDRIQRYFSQGFRLRSHINLAKEFESLRLTKVPDLPYQETVQLSSQTYKSKSEIDATKSPVIMLHGLFGAKQNYSSVGRNISTLTNRKVTGIDLRNHGASAHAAPHTYMAMALDTIEHIDGHVKAPVILAGHLMGAKVSMLVSLLRPDLVEKLIVIDNSPVTHVLEAQFTRDLVGMCHVERDRSLVDLPQSALLQKIDKILLKFEKDPLVRVFLASNLVRRQSKTDKLPVRFRVPVLNFLKDDILSELGKWPEEVAGLKYDGPVKIMKGARSNFVLEEHMDSAFPTHFSDTLLSVFEAGHWLVSEMPDQFVRETVEFTES